ncbi:unannotated protein [freshwater metagenome]|uniref:Unannotated protein n=1 Tax=freshwater metagenome TaxID=449393 RepID=A0A6J7BY48_9ZZZZ
MDSAETSCDKGEEGLDLADEIVGLAFGHDTAQPGLGRGTLTRPCREEGCPLDELGGDLGEQYPRTAQPP